MPTVLDEELIAALRSSDERIIELFVNRIFQEDYKAYRPLFVALILDSEERIQVALDAINFEALLGDENMWYRPLHVAVLLNSAHGIRQIHARGCPIDLRNYEAQTALGYAVDFSLVGMVEALLNAVADVKVLEGDWTMLYKAAYNSSPGCALALLNHGACIDSRANDGATPLLAIFHEALFPPHNLNVVKLLLAHGADVNARFTSGTCAAQNALSRALKEMEQLHGDEAEEEIEVVRELLLWAAQIRNEDVDLLRETFQKKPLLLAVLLGEPIDEATRNADLEDRNDALRFAVARRQVCIQALINCGAEVNVGLEIVDEILRRQHLKPEEREAYETIRDNLRGGGVSPLHSLIVRRADIHDAFIRNPQSASLPQELQERLLRAILLSGMRSFNTDRVCRALAAGADPTPHIAHLQLITRHAEIADLLFLAAQGQAKKISRIFPEWLGCFRRTFDHALDQGDSSYIRLLMQAGICAFNEDDYVKFLRHIAFSVDANQGFKLMKTFLDAHVVLPRILLDRVWILADRPEIAFLITERARAEGDSSYIRLLMQAGICAFNEDDYVKFLRHIAFSVDAHQGLKLMKTFLDAHVVLPRILLDRVWILADRPEIAFLITERARAAGILFIEPHWLADWKAQMWYQEFKKSHGFH